MFLNGVSTFATLETRQRQIGDLQTRLQRVSQELTTGRSQDVARTLGSATEVYESMVRSRDAAEALLQRNIVIGGRLDAGQAALSLIDGSIERLAEDVIAALGRDDQTALSAHLGAAQASLGESIAALNSHQLGVTSFPALWLTRPHSRPPAPLPRKSVRQSLVRSALRRSSPRSTRFSMPECRRFSTLATTQSRRRK